MGQNAGDSLSSHQSQGSDLVTDFISTNAAVSYLERAGYKQDAKTSSH